MSPKVKSIILLAFIFSIVLAVRLNLAFRYTEFTSDDAYFSLRQVENIKKTGLPLYNDPLSYGGTTYVFLPLFHYILAFFNLFLPLYFTCKLIPNILAATFVIVTYVLSYHLTKNEKASILASLVSGFVPIFLKATINDISVYSLVIPLNFLAIYFFLRLIKEKKYSLHFIITFILILLANPSVILLLIGLIFYLAIGFLEKIRIERSEIEITLFSFFAYCWLMFLIFKNSLLNLGPKIIWQNIPTNMIVQYFTNVSIILAIYSIGALTLLCGAYVIYLNFFEKITKEIFILIGFSLSIFLALWLKLIEINIGFIFLGSIFVFFFAEFLKLLFSWFEKTKFSRHEKWLVLAILIMVITTSVIPAIELSLKYIKKYTPQEEEMKALKWLKNVPPDSVIISAPNEGHKVTFISKRKNVMDSNYLASTDINERFHDTENIFKGFSSTETIKLLNKYGVNYVFFSDYAKEAYNEKNFKSFSPECFELVFDEEPLIYKLNCRVEQI